MTSCIEKVFIIDNIKRILDNYNNKSNELNESVRSSFSIKSQFVESKLIPGKNL